MEHQQSFYSPRIGARVGLIVVGSVGVEELGINDGVEVLGVVELGINDGVEVLGVVELGINDGVEVLGVVGSDVGVLVGNVVDGRNVGATAGAMDGRIVGTIDGSDIKVTYPQIFVEMVIFKL
jgi:hypothetical protein